MSSKSEDKAEVEVETRLEEEISVIEPQEEKRDDQEEHEGDEDVIFEQGVDKVEDIKEEERENYGL